MTAGNAETRLVQPSKGTERGHRTKLRQLTVATSELLEDLGRSSDGHSPEMLLLATGEKLRGSDTTLDGSRGVDAVDNQSNLTLDSLILDVGVLMEQGGMDLVSCCLR